MACLERAEEHLHAVVGAVSHRFMRDNGSELRVYQQPSRSSLLSHDGLDAPAREARLDGHPSCVGIARVQGQDVGAIGSLQRM